MQKSGRIIITGFGPFGDVVDNPSSRLAEQVAKRVKNVTVYSKIQVSMSAVEKLLREDMDREGALLIIHLGVNIGSRVVEFQLEAKNIKLFNIPDADGVSSEGEPIDPLGPNTLSTSLSAFIPSPINSSTSHDAGTYICNYLYYRSLQEGFRSIFIHIAPFEVLGKDEQCDVICEFIKAAVLNL